MTPERWLQIKSVLGQALELRVEQRNAFLDRTCNDDHALRQELESLLAAGEEGRSSFLQFPPRAPKLEKGARLGEYEIQSLLGAGGMGEVYRARDIRLRRDVAVKVLPAFVLSDPERLRRFEQEAMAAAALNHPNILAVFQMGTHEDAPFLVAELLEGETLRDQIKQRRIAWCTALDYALQIAHGLEAAHEKGIVHRDLKPENLFVTKDGRVKILDFGLAKLTQPRGDSDHNAPTVGGNTEPGVVMGTAAYMSPEQVRGESTDSRADIFAFGAVLYELLTGKRAFQKPTSAETMVAILHEDPPAISQLTPSLSSDRLNPDPAEFERIINKCFKKDRELRYQHAADIRSELERLKENATYGSKKLAEAAPRAGAAKSRRFWIAGLGIAVVAAAGIFARAIWPVPPPRVLTTTQLTRDGLPKFQLFTDGSRLYISEKKVADEFIVQASVTGGESSVLATPFANVSPTDISPDHTQLMVFEGGQTETERRAWILPVPVGAPRRLMDLEGGWAAWSHDGTHLVLTRGRDLLLANANGSAAHKLTSLPGIGLYAHFSPDGRRIRFTVAYDDRTESIWEIRVDGTDLHRVFSTWAGSGSEHDGVWSADGRYYFFLAKPGALWEIWAVRERAEVFQRGSQIPTKLAAGPLSYGQMAPSPDGKKLYVDGYNDRAELLRYDANSRQFVQYLSGISAGEFDFSRDGKWITYVSYPDGSLWKCRTDGSDRVQLTYPPISAILPRWSPDGAEIAFVDGQPGKPSRILLLPSAGGTPREAYVENRNQADPTWSPDGGRLVFGRDPTQGSTEKTEVYVLDLSSRQVSVIPGSEGLYSPRWSPDGQYILAMTNDSKRLLLYDLKTKKWSDWINEPGLLGSLNWSPDGHYLYYDTMTTDRPSFRRVRIGETHSKSLFDLKDLPRYQGGIGAWSGLTPDGSGLFVKSLSTDEIYALDLDLP
jgi:serine/threonine protein kinase/Tol biopolymer transport system component